MNDENQELENSIEDDMAEIELLIANMDRMRRELNEAQRPRAPQRPIHFNPRTRDDKDHDGDAAPGFRR